MLLDSFLLKYRAVRLLGLALFGRLRLVQSLVFRYLLVKVNLHNLVVLL